MTDSPASLSDLDDFFRSVETAARRLLLLDYDGTLAPFREARDEAVPYPGVRDRVKALARAAHTRVVVISGRSVADLRPLLAVEPPPEIWGTHGWERYRPDQGLQGADLGEAEQRGLERARDRAREIAPRGSVEVKPASVAVHVRGLPDARRDEVAHSVRQAWRDEAEGSGLEIHDFDGGVELRVPGRDKGTAVREILAEEPDEAVVAYLGDDWTDEDAFRALDGRGLRVLVRTRWRESCADAWIHPPEELLAFLDRWNSAATGE
jgi:trehalose-phosphatase